MTTGFKVELGSWINCDETATNFIANTAQSTIQDSRLLILTAVLTTVNVNKLILKFILLPVI